MFAADHYHHRDGLNDYDDDYRQLKNLSQEVADRLREWTRQPDDQGEDIQRQPEQAERDIKESADAAEAKLEDTSEADDASFSDDQTQADRVKNEIDSDQPKRDAQLDTQPESSQGAEENRTFKEKDQTQKNR